MKKAQKLTIAIASLLAVSALTSCAKQEEFLPDDGKSYAAEPIKTKAPVKSNTSDTEEIRTFVFNSTEDVETVSDDDLIYIATHYSAVLDQVSDKKEPEIDLFGVPLAEKTVDGNTYREDVRAYVLQCKLPPTRINVNEPFPDEIFQEYIDEHCKSLISNNGKTGISTKDNEIIYCGENDLYVEYSIRYTEVRTYYENKKLVTHEIPIAYRCCFYKDRLYVNFGDHESLVYFGETAMDKVAPIMKLLLSGEYSGRSIYTEFSETEEAYICTSYHVYTCMGDWGLCDTANLEKVVAVFDKNTHEICNKYGDFFSREVKIPGTYHEIPQRW